MGKVIGSSPFGSTIKGKNRMETEALKKLIHDSSNALAISLGMAESAKRILETPAAPNAAVDLPKALEKLEKSILSMKKHLVLLQEVKSTLSS
jgi:hypothetical protein